MKTAIRLIEKGLVPKFFIRKGIRKLLEDRLEEQTEAWQADSKVALQQWTESMRGASVALVPEIANEQHYEVPPAFFERVLGKRLKYSSAWYESADTSLDEAEDAMLRLTCIRAKLYDGQRVLELGCGWGSLTLWMAEKYPDSEIVAVSNSAPQREFIEQRAQHLGLSNVTVLTRDMNSFHPEPGFDRVVSVEMFEHMRNWEELLRRVHKALKPDGLAFIHVFAHKQFAYPFEARDESDWMSRHFFTGGMMPSVEMIDSLCIPFEIENRWPVNGTHYARTSEDWLRNLETHSKELMPVLEDTYGAGNGAL
ncbi:MAG: cyclopropane-fatty-acyl-phospholipid synthase, partial [Planctomycetota bacterium]